MSIEINNSGDVERAVLEIFGGPLRETGVICWLEAWRGPADCLVALRRGRPATALRKLIRGLAHYRADAVVTAPEIMGPTRDWRAVAPMTLPNERRLERALRAWRSELLGRRWSPITLVLDPRSETDLDHPALAGSGRKLILTDLEGLWGLESRAADRGIEVVATETPSPQSALQFLRRELGAATVVLELDPSTLFPPSAQTSRIDELMLVVLEAPRLATDDEGSWILPLDDLHAAFSHCPEPWIGGPADEPWSVYRWKR